jgi:cytochrome c553
MKRILLSILLCGGLFLAAAIISPAQDGQMEADDSTGLPNNLWKRGLAISPVPINMNGRNKKLVGQGSYIVNALAACTDCHTNPPYLAGGNPFLGQPAQANTAHFLAGGVQFGPFTGRNITPDPSSGRPAGLTLDQFIETMRTGIDSKNLHPQFGPFLQVMPWPVYAKMTDDDLRAIYEYLSAIPHAEPAP